MVLLHQKPHNSFPDSSHLHGLGFGSGKIHLKGGEIMTSNMIAFRNYEENVRHNREMERLTGEQQAEAKRHNYAVEYETNRSNRADESIRGSQNAINYIHYNRMDNETNRANEVREYYQYERPTTNDLDLLKLKSDVDRQTWEAWSAQQSGNLNQVRTETELIAQPFVKDKAKNEVNLIASQAFEARAKGTDAMMQSAQRAKTADATAVKGWGSGLRDIVSAFRGGWDLFQNVVSPLE